MKLGIITGTLALTLLLGCGKPNAKPASDSGSADTSPASAQPSSPVVQQVSLSQNTSVSQTQTTLIALNHSFTATGAGSVHASLPSQQVVVVPTETVVEVSGDQNAAVAVLPVPAAEKRVGSGSPQAIRFDARPGSKVRMEGTSNIHDWQVEGKLIGGYVEAGANFPILPGQSVQPGVAEVKAEGFIPVRSMASIEKDGRPYSTRMDDIMYEKLKAQEYPRTIFYFTALQIKSLPQRQDLPYTGASHGALVVAGATNRVSMPVTILPLPDNRLKITGIVTVRMTDFGIEPPTLALLGPLIKTGDEVKLFIEWNLARKAS